MPNIERLQLLVDALCSGEYEQNMGSLRYNDKFCCLGVACDVYRKPAQSAYWEDNVFVTADGARALSSMPTEVQEWYELSYSQGDIWFKYDGPAEYSSAMAMNDNDFDFLAIARKIVENFPGLTMPEVHTHA
jgi:hypothetical protein